MIRTFSLYDGRPLRGVQCLRSDACTKHTSTKQKSWLDGHAQKVGPGSDNKTLSQELSKIKIM